MPTGLPRPLASVARRLAPPPDGPDADLLARWVADRDEAAFEALVRRHGPTVRAIARARLGNPADADDATQAAFLVLARDAAKVRESVAGWLARVAHLTALQHRRNMARRTTDALPADPPGPHPDPAVDAATQEDRALVAEELAGLPDRLRGVLVLCGLEGRSNTEAAELLGVPKGTVDSRLAAAKKLLHARLARRGVTAAVAAASLDRLATDTASAAVGFTDLAHLITANAGQYLTGALDVSAVRLLADGVTPTMSSASRLIALAMLTVAVSGTAGLGLYHASAGPQEPKKEPPKPAAKAEPPKPKEAPPAAPTAEDGPRALGSEQEVRGMLAGPSGLRDLDSLTLGALLDLLNARGVLARVDMPALIRNGLGQDVRTTIYDTRLRGPRNPERLPLADVLTDVLGQVEFGPQLRLAYRVRGNQIVIGPAYEPPFLPGPVGDQAPRIENDRLIEQLNGPPVSVVFANTPIAKAVESLRRETGANIVLDPKVPHDQEPTVTATFDDVRLRTVLQVVADVAGYRLVTLDNVYYLTSPGNAEVMHQEMKRPLFGGPEPAGQVLVPPGFVTDGYQYFPRTADMKPSDAFGGHGGGGLGGLGGAKPVPAPPPAKKVEKK